MTDPTTREQSASLAAPVLITVQLSKGASTAPPTVRCAPAVRIARNALQTLRCQRAMSVSVTALQTSWAIALCVRDSSTIVGSSVRIAATSAPLAQAQAVNAPLAKILTRLMQMAPVLAKIQRSTTAPSVLNFKLSAPLANTTMASRTVSLAVPTATSAKM